MSSRYITATFSRIARYFSVVAGRAIPWMVVGGVFLTPVKGARLQNSQQPTFRTEANFIRVDVYATLKGVAVTDLRQEDFEILEDNAPQTITTFEHVLIRGGTPQETRIEPNTVAQSRALLENSRARVFAIFLDTNHVSDFGAYNIRQPLVTALNRLIGPEDVVGVMTPDMAASDVTFARRTTTIEGILARHWNWGERDQVHDSRDPREEAYQRCYPGLATLCGDDRGIADQMIARRREKMTLDAMSDLVAQLESAREERKALLVISEGWLLYRPDQSLARRVNTCEPPAPPVGTDPRTGRLAIGPTAAETGVSSTQCESDRMAIAQLNDEEDFRLTLDRANRANVTFYPIDPRGLVVFDTPIDTQRTGQRPPGQPTLTPPSVDSAMLRSRQNSLRDLAAATDGITIMNSNNLDAGLRRVTDDLSSYYLLGYYSTGKLDGKFHSIRVRVKRPSVDVRARRGYLAPSAADVARVQTARAPTAAEAPVATSAAAAVAAAIASLGSTTRDAGVRISLVSGPRAAGGDAIWAVGEFTGDEWRSGADADLTLATSEGRTVATARARIAAGARSFLAMLSPTVLLENGDYVVRMRATPLSQTATPITELQRISIVQQGVPVGVVLSRRGPSTGNRDFATIDARFRRNEQLRADIADATGEVGAARLLDRNGNPMPVPVSTSTRTDAEGTRWISAALNLAPLAAGEYVIEWAARTGGAGGAGGAVTPTLIAFRVVP